MESLAATAILREEFPWLKVRFVNVVDLFKLVSEGEHPHGLADRDFDSLFTTDKPIIFNFHGYPWLIHKLVYRRSHQERIHVRGYKEQGNINTPLELAIKNEVDRFNLVIDVIDRVPKLGSARRRVMPRSGCGTRLSSVLPMPMSMVRTKMKLSIGSGLTLSSAT